MLFGAVLVVLTLSGSIATTLPRDVILTTRSAQTFPFGFGVGVFADFKVSADTMNNYGPVFTRSCQQNKIGTVVDGLAKVRVSFEGLGRKCRSGAFAHADIKVASTNFFEMIVQLQSLIRIIHTHGKVSSCKGSIVALNAPLNVMVNFLVAGGVDVNAKCRSYGTAIDLGLFVQVGINLGISAQVSAGAQATVGAGVRASVGASAVLPDFQASLSAMVNFAPVFETSCKQKKISPVISGLTQIRTSFVGLGSKCRSGISAQTDVAVIAPHFFELMIKLQALLRIISNNNQISSCQDSISSFQAPLSVMLNFLVAGGVDVKATIDANASIDLDFFAEVGISLDVQVNVSAAASA